MNERITTTIAEIRRGALNQEAAEEMTKVIQAVRETGKAGKLTITIDVKPLANHEGAWVNRLKKETSWHATKKPPKHNTHGRKTAIYPIANTDRRPS